MTIEWLFGGVVANLICLLVVAFWPGRSVKEIAVAIKRLAALHAHLESRLATLERNFDFHVKAVDGWAGAVNDRLFPKAVPIPEPDPTRWVHEPSGFVVVSTTATSPENTTK